MFGAGRRVLDLVVRERAVPVEGQGFGGPERHVAPELRLVLGVIQHDPLVVVEGGAEVVLDVTRASTHRELVGARPRGLEKAVHAQIQLRTTQIRLRVGPIRPHPVEAVDDLGGPHGLAYPTPLGEDLDDTGRPLGPVEGRGRRTTDDLDPVDVLRIDVVEGTRRVVVALAPAGGSRRVPWWPIALDAHAVHVDEWLVAHGGADVASIPQSSAPSPTTPRTIAAR